VARPVANFDAEIAALEADCTNLMQSYAINGRSAVYADWQKKRERLDRLYLMRDRVSGDAPMIIRGVPTGLR
jgi:hypothetical protein